MMQPLRGITVLDFSTLLPGPMASLMLAEAGARVIKIERPGGDELRQFPPEHGTSSAPFMSLNGGKLTEILDLKQPLHLARARELALDADVLIEQFRPGVMQRLGLGHEALRAANPRLIYCSITGFGQTGARATMAGHDLNYQALSGVLSQGLVRGAPPPMPPALIADIAGGAYPAVMNILLALRQRDASGEGCHLDISMTDGAAAFGWFPQAMSAASGIAPAGGGSLLTGGSPRYRIYPTSDGWFLTVAALEDRFWSVFTAAIDLPEPLRDARAPADAVFQAIADIISASPADHWRSVLEPMDCCCAVVRTLDDVDIDTGPRVRDSSGATIPLARVPIDARFRASAEIDRTVPELNGLTD